MHKIIEAPKPENTLMRFEFKPIATFSTLMCFHNLQVDNRIIKKSNVLYIQTGYVGKWSIHLTKENATSWQHVSVIIFLFSFVKWWNIQTCLHCRQWQTALQCSIVPEDYLCKWVSLLCYINWLVLYFSMILFL